MCTEVAVGLLWFTQYLMIIWARFSHSGRVCAGEYADDQLVVSNIDPSQTTLKMDKFNLYFLRDEGSFLYYYVVACIIVFFSFFVCACCTGTCLFFLGSATSLQFVEQILKDFDKLPEMMRAKAQGKAREADPFGGSAHADNESAFRD